MASICIPALERTGPATLPAPETKPTANSAGRSHQPASAARSEAPISMPSAEASAGRPIWTMPVRRVPGRSLTPASIEPSPARTPGAGWPVAMPAPSSGPAHSAPRATAAQGTGSRCQWKGWASQAGTARGARSMSLLRRRRTDGGKRFRGASSADGAATSLRSEMVHTTATGLPHAHERMAGSRTGSGRDALPVSGGMRCRLRTPGGPRAVPPRRRAPPPPRAASFPPLSRARHSG